MMEDKPFSGGSLRVTLDQIANADRIREAQHWGHVQTTNRRSGHKGSRQWGYWTPGTGRRGKRR